MQYQFITLRNIHIYFVETVGTFIPMLLVLGLLYMLLLSILSTFECFILSIIIYVYYNIIVYSSFITYLYIENEYPIQL